MGAKVFVTMIDGVNTYYSDDPNIDIVQLENNYLDEEYRWEDEDIEAAIDREKLGKSMVPHSCYPNRDKFEWPSDPIFQIDPKLAKIYNKLITVIRARNKNNTVTDDELAETWKEFTDEAKALITIIEDYESRT